MTNDFKKDILDYITNNVTPTSSSTQQILESTEEIAKEVIYPYLPSGWYGMDLNIIKSSTNGNYVLYGGYLTTNDEPRGIIVILDNEFKPVKSIYNYSSGTLLRPIQKMIQIEDGTFVGIDSTEFTNKEDRSNIQSNQKRFIMLNNMSMKDKTNDYRVILRRSYILPYPNFYCIDIVKNPNSSHYLFAGASYIPIGSGHNDEVTVIDLKVNVGMENEWANYMSDTSVTTIYGGFYGEFDSDDNASWEALATRNPAGNVIVTLWDNSTYQTIMQTSGTLNPYVDSLAMNNQTVFKNKNEIYFVVNNERWVAESIPRYVGLYKYNNTNKELKEIYLKNIGNYDYYHSREGIFLTYLNGDVYINYCDNYNYQNSTANYNYQRLENDVWNPILIYENKKYSMERINTFTGNTYNLVNNIIFNKEMNASKWEMELIKEIYNSTNYNSTPYTNYNSTVTRQGTLYSNGTLVFARNLYNSTLFNNSATHTVNVPNTLLNGVEIDNEKLIGATNTILVNKTSTITKNIYENLYINFINTINVLDEDTNKYFQDTATYINQNVNIGTQTNCENTFVGKVNINFTTPITQNIIWTWNTDHYETSFTIDCRTEIPSSIDFISNDSSTIYLSKIPNITVGSYYTVSQKIRIE